MAREGTQVVTIPPATATATTTVLQADAAGKAEEAMLDFVLCLCAVSRLSSMSPWFSLQPDTISSLTFETHCRATGHDLMK